MDAKKIKKLSELSAPKKLGAYLSRKKMAMPQRGGGRKTGAESIRQLVHGVHKIVIRTTYRFEVDGKVIKVPLGVDDSGQVHCHSLPNYQTASAVDMIKALIDNFPDDFAQRRTRPKPRITKRPQKKR